MQKYGRLLLFQALFHDFLSMIFPPRKNVSLPQNIPPKQYKNNKYTLYGNRIKR
jgi:hypothetical protein